MSTFQVINAYRSQAAPGGSGTDPHFASTILLSSLDGVAGVATYTDESAAAHGFLGGANVTVDTTNKAFGLASARFGSSRNGQFAYSDHADWTLGTSDFTHELFYYHEQNTQREVFLSHYASTGNQRGFLFRYVGNVATPVLAFLATSDGTAGTAVNTVTGNWTPTIQTWYYYCVERSGNTWRIYAGPLGGTASMVGTGTSSISIFNSSATLRVGQTGDGIEGCYGNMDEVRTTLGVARYATDAGYPVPTAAFPRS